MIGRLTGQLLVCEPGQVLIDVGGIGYEVEIPLTTYYALNDAAVNRPEAAVILHTHMVVREDAQLLFGFSSPGERDMFRTLIKVNGIGPKVGLAILSGLDAPALATAVNQNDLKSFTAIPGIGKKTAERLIVELRDKVEKLSISGSAAPVNMPQDTTGDAESALIGLGYKPQEAARAIAQIEDPGDDVESLIRQALKELMRT